MRTVALSLVLAGSAAAQSTVALAKPTAELPDPLTRLRSLRELPNGKVLVTDLNDKVVQLVDFGAGSATKVGREGQGPGEYALPSDLFGLPNGETWLYDMLNRRFLPIDQNGKTGATTPMPGQTGGGIVIGIRGGGSDGQGRLYFQGPPFNPASPGGAPPDSIAILRWDRVKPNMDTVGWIRQPKAEVKGSSGGGRFEVRLGAEKVFTPTEAWGVAGDGAIARVIPNPFQVVWYPPNGKPSAGPVVPYAPIKVAEADRQEVIEQQKRAKPMMIAIGGNGRAVAPKNIKLPEPEFQDTKPPFIGQDGVQVAPEGEVWVLRTRPASDKIPTYDVFDRTGKVVRRVALNPRSRVVGFGKGTVYVVRTDDEDLEHLQRFTR